MINKLLTQVLNSAPLGRKDGLYISHVAGDEILELFLAANRLRWAFRSDSVDLCSIVNAKSGDCPENCSYCAQSSKAKADIEKYPLMDRGFIAKRAEEAKAFGAKRFCIVTSGKKTSKPELKRIALMIKDVRRLGLLPCATLGILDKDELSLLKDSGLERYHHNLETSERFFPEICSTHTYAEKIKTIRAVKAAGLSLCSGGIFGLGEEWEDRVDMAIALRELGADSVPVNFLMPVKGTPLEAAGTMHPFEALKIISLYRFILPDREIRVCGGRAQTLGEFNSFVFMAGADGLLIGDYLTTAGRSPEADLRLIEMWGLSAG
ncbi:MAG: biotin synthase BioB [Parvibaculum sp.]|uniref:biotin synthase BioB n=1 Tax=Parvibaculum sp. TaxID=2024848 RepID=UPI0027305969|nr:biotin synthase BioB [Parvibaculum sp.]MDP2151613.1 biotin synthase BioB [Parvibaculum sp.]